ncbi:hypothetical protein ACVRW4_05725 [Streptococcus phocae subsp. phocae]
MEFDSFLIPSENKEILVEKEVEVYWKKFTRIVMNLLVYGSVICIFLWIVFIKKYIFVTILLTIFICMQSINEIYYYVLKLYYSLKIGGNKKLTWNALQYFLNLIMIFLILGHSQRIEWIIININSINNLILSDVLLLVFLFIVSFIYLFLSFFLLLEINKSFIIIFSYIGKHFFRGNTRKIFAYNSILKPKPISYTYKIITLIDSKNNVATICFLFIPFFVFDLIASYSMLVIRVLKTVAYYCIIVFLRIRDTFNQYKIWYSHLSEGRIIIFLFRATAITTIVGIVIYNRHHSFMRLDKSITPILEFLSSTLLIPVVLSWILELKNKKEEHPITSNKYHRKSSKKIKKYKYNVRMR